MSFRKIYKEVLGTSVNDCLDCPSGFIHWKDIYIIDCQAGKYSPIVSSTYYASCEEGNIVV